MVPPTAVSALTGPRDELIAASSPSSEKLNGTPSVDSLVVAIRMVHCPADTGTPTRGKATAPVSRPVVMTPSAGKSIGDPPAGGIRRTAIASRPPGQVRLNARLRVVDVIG